MSSLGERLRITRKSLGLTQTELAEKCKFNTENRARICLYERNYRVPNHEDLTKISKSLNVSLDYLITGNEFYNLKKLK